MIVTAFMNMFYYLIIDLLEARQRIQKAFPAEGISTLLQSCNQPRALGSGYCDFILIVALIIIIVM